MKQAALVGTAHLICWSSSGHTTQRGAGRCAGRHHPLLDFPVALAELLVDELLGMLRRRRVVAEALHVRLAGGADAAESDGCVVALDGDLPELVGRALRE